MREQIAHLNAEFTAFKTSAEGPGATPSRNTGRSPSVSTGSRRARSNRSQKLAKIAEAVERLERRTVAATPTAANDVTGTVPVRPAAPETKAPPKPAILDNWVVRRVYDGVALVEGRMGVIEVEPGQTLPNNGGRVEEIRRQDGSWVVVTSRGLILSSRDR